MHVRLAIYMASMRAVNKDKIIKLLNLDNNLK